MHRFQYTGVVTLALWTIFAAVSADAQELVRIDTSSGSHPLLLPSSHPTPDTDERNRWVTWRFADDRRFAGVARVQDAPLPGNDRPARGPARKVFGTIVGAAGGFFAGGYLGATIEGDRCHCDDPGLQGALIGAPIGAVVGGVLGFHFLF
jgi:hypothetical protein